MLATKLLLWVQVYHTPLILPPTSHSNTLAPGLSPAWNGYSIQAGFLTWRTSKECPPIHITPLFPTPCSRLLLTLWSCCSHSPQSVCQSLLPFSTSSRPNYRLRPGLYASPPQSLSWPSRTFSHSNHLIIMHLTRTMYQILL